MQLARCPSHKDDRLDHTVKHSLRLISNSKHWCFMSDKMSSISFTLTGSTASMLSPVWGTLVPSVSGSKRPLWGSLSGCLRERCAFFGFGSIRGCCSSCLRALVQPRISEQGREINEQCCYTHIYSCPYTVCTSIEHDYTHVLIMYTLSCTLSKYIRIYTHTCVCTV